MRKAMITIMAIVAILVNSAEASSMSAAAKRGEIAFNKGGCGKCHIIGKVGSGPDLVGVLKKHPNGEKWVARWILHPERMYNDPYIKAMIRYFNLKMPNQGMTEKQVADIIEYLKWIVVIKQDKKQKREFIAKEQNRLKKYHSFDGSLFSKINLNDSMQDIKNQIAAIEKSLKEKEWKQFEVEKRIRKLLAKEQKRLKKLYSFNGDLFSQIKQRKNIQDVKNQIAAIEKRLKEWKQFKIRKQKEVKKQKVTIYTKEQKKLLVAKMNKGQVDFKTVLKFFQSQYGKSETFEHLDEFGEKTVKSQICTISTLGLNLNTPEQKAAYLAIPYIYTAVGKHYEDQLDSFEFAVTVKADVRLSNLTRSIPIAFNVSKDFKTKNQKITVTLDVYTLFYRIMEYLIGDTVSTTTKIKRDILLNSFIIANNNKKFVYGCMTSGEFPIYAPSNLVEKIVRFAVHQKNPKLLKLLLMFQNGKSPSEISRFMLRDKPTKTIFNYVKNEVPELMGR